MHSNNAMSDNVDWTTMASSDNRILRLGNVKFERGRTTFPAASGTDVRYHIDFPEAFSETPTVISTVGNWLALRANWVDSINASGFYSGVTHNQGSTVNVSVEWLAFGAN